MERTEGLRGIGIALGYQWNGLFNADMYPCSVELTLNEKGVLEIKTGMISSDSDNGNVWSGLASEILGINKKMIRVSYNANSPDSGPSTTSRNIAVLTKLIEQACRAIQKRKDKTPLPITVRKTAHPRKSDDAQERFP
jgi:hypothetical protein